MKTYTYKANSYDNLYDLAEALAHDGTFIPRTISDTDLEQLGVNVAETEEPIENIRTRKIFELKRQRDAAEVEPVEYGGHLYDYDSKARDRIAAAIIALELQGEEATIEWTTADNEDAVVTAQDLRMIIASVAARSNKLHTAYRAAKAKVESASTAEEVEAVAMNN